MVAAMMKTLKPNVANALLFCMFSLLVACQPAAPAVKPEASPTASPAPRPKEVTVWAYFASYMEMKVLRQEPKLIREVNFFWYQLAPDGSIGGSNQDPYSVAEVQKLGTRVVPSIMNVFDAVRVHATLVDAQKRQAHVQDLVQLVVENNYDGIDIDYESMFPEDREVFSLFIEELAAGLHAKGKLLSVTVHPKTSDAPQWDAPKSQDWQRLGAAADEFKIMVYDYSSGGSKAGMIAPVDWAEAVIAYAATQVPLEKTYLGLPFYGYDWVGSQGKSLTWQQVQNLIRMHNITPLRAANNEGYFSYGSENRNTVYFTDALSTKTKVEAILKRHPQLAGVCIWYLGGEDPENWPALQRLLQPVP